MKKESVMTNLVWRFAERCGAQIVQFVVSIVLARMLDPELYGTIALVTIFTTILQVFVDSGLGNALIQKKDADDLDFSSVFFFNSAFCLFLYGLMFFAAPLIAHFYEKPELVAVIRVLSLTIVVSGMKNVQQAYVSRTMQFKKFFFSTLFGTVGAAVIGIWLAYKGYGIWALVAQQLFNVTLDTCLLWITVKWRPKLMFSLERMKTLFSYGWKLLVSTLIDVVYGDIRQLIIGKLYSEADLAYYNRGKQFPNLIVANINTSIDSVLLPTLSQAQDDVSRVKAMTRRAMKVSTYFMAPLMMGLAFCGEPLIRLVLTEKWLPSVPLMRIFCITFMFYPLHTSNLNAIKAMGKSDIFLKLEILKKLVGIILLVSTMWFGVMAMAYSLLVSSLASQIINSFPNKKLLGYGYIEQMKDILPGILLAVAMGVCVYFFKYLPIHDVFILLLQLVVGVVIYLAGSKIFKLEAFDYLMSIVKQLFNRKKAK